MALITCSDCNTKVSARAENCPKCGAPIASAQETNAVGARLVTTQGTAKSLKLHKIVSISLVIVGAFWIYMSGQPLEETSAWPPLMILVGIVWYIATRFRIWWHHD